MTRIIYLPLDERPVNRVFPAAILPGQSGIELVTPPLGVLGEKRRPASLDRLWTWLETELATVQYLVVSLDLLFYGGLVPSRLHHLSRSHLENCLRRLTALKQSHPILKIYAFNVIMRVPAHSQGNEEPDYYQDYGEQIFRLGWLEDKVTQGKGTAAENEELKSIEQSIPGEVRADYFNRRELNHLVNKAAINLAREGILDFLVIPLDDCAKYGFSAAEQRRLLKLVEQDTLHDKVHLYPGADEVGCTLLCRIYHQLKRKRPRVFPRYSSTLGPGLIPRYEDRPLGESIKSQITVCGGVLVDNSLDADLILMVNSPTIGEQLMPSASAALRQKDSSYSSFRNLREFAEILEYYLSSGKKVALADVAYGNGADHELMRLLNKRGLLGKLVSYAAWNTPGNTLGTVLAHALLRLAQQQERPDRFLIDRYVEDWGYQVQVRAYLTERAGELGISYFDLADQAPKIAALAGQKLQEFLQMELGPLATGYELGEVYFPWNRLFEIGLNSRLEH